MGASRGDSEEGMGAMVYAVRGGALGGTRRKPAESRGESKDHLWFPTQLALGHHLGSLTMHGHWNLNHNL